MTKITEGELERLVVEELKRNGYPSDAIVPEWKNKNTRIDIVIMDQDTQIPLMIIECKSVTNSHSVEVAANQLRRYWDTLDYPVKAYAAFHGADGKVEFYDFTKKITDYKVPISECGPTNLPSYEEIRTGAESKYISTQKKQKRRYINGLRIVCWGVVPVLIIAIFILDMQALYPLTTERLILLGILILTLLLPFFGEIKVGEVTLSNKKKDEENDV